jgi:hypothetical protein
VPADGASDGDTDRERSTGPLRPRPGNVRLLTFAASRLRPSWLRASVQPAGRARIENCPDRHGARLPSAYPEEIQARIDLHRSETATAVAR